MALCPRRSTGMTEGRWLSPSLGSKAGRTPGGLQSITAIPTVSEDGKEGTQAELTTHFTFIPRTDEHLSYIRELFLALTKICQWCHLKTNKYSAYLELSHPRPRIWWRVEVGEYLSHLPCKPKLRKSPARQWWWTGPHSARAWSPRPEAGVTTAHSRPFPRPPWGPRLPSRFSLFFFFSHFRFLFILYLHNEPQILKKNGISLFYTYRLMSQKTTDIFFFLLFFI